MDQILKARVDFLWELFFVCICPTVTLSLSVEATFAGSEAEFVDVIPGDRYKSSPTKDVHTSNHIEHLNGCSLDDDRSTCLERRDPGVSGAVVVRVLSAQIG